MSKKAQKIVDYVLPEIQFEFLEDSSEVDGENVLAKVRGVFFLPNGISRNNRYYSKSLWERALAEPEVVEKLKTKTMFGTIGHDTELNDKSLSEGKISHIVTRAAIDENDQGIGEALILNTPSGRILNTILRAGANIFVSSRANGRFNGTKNGVPAVDENSYSLKGWDFVLRPGFLQANPKIAEEYNDNIIEGEVNMSDRSLERMFEENATLRESLAKKDAQVEKQVNEALKPIEEENAHLKTQVSEAEVSLKELRESVSELEEEKTKLEESLSKYSELGESFESIKEALELSEEFQTEVLELGSPSEIEEALTKANEMKEQWESLGEVDQVKAALEIAEKLLDEKKEAEYQEKIKEMAKKYKMKESAIDRLMKKGMTEEEIEDFVKEMADGEEEDKPSKKDESEEDLGSTNEDENEAPKKSRAMRLMESFS